MIDVNTSYKRHWERRSSTFTLTRQCNPHGTGTDTFLFLEHNFFPFSYICSCCSAILVFAYTAVQRHFLFVLFYFCHVYMHLCEEASAHCLDVYNKPRGYDGGQPGSVRARRPTSP